MATAWYIIPYVRQTPPAIAQVYTRSLALLSSGVAYTNAQALDIRGNRAIVKVQASNASLTTLNGLYKRLPVGMLDNPLASLTTPQKNALVSELQDQGYTAQDINAALPNSIGTYTLRDVLRFMARGRRLPVYNAGTDSLDEGDVSDNSAMLDTVDGAIVDSS